PVVEFPVVRLDHGVEVPGEPGVPRCVQERVQPLHAVREPGHQGIAVTQVVPGSVEGGVQRILEPPPGGGAPVDDVAVVPVVPDEEPGAVVRYRLHDLVGGADVVARHEVRVAQAVGIFRHLVRRHEPLSSSHARVFSWSFGQYGWSCRGNASSITGRDSAGGTVMVVGVDVVPCDKACTNNPLSAASSGHPSPAGRAPVHSPLLYSAPQLTVLGTDLLHSLPQDAENLLLRVLIWISKGPAAAGNGWGRERRPVPE